MIDLAQHAFLAIFNNNRNYLILHPLANLTLFDILFLARDLSDKYFIHLYSYL